MTGRRGWWLRPTRVLTGLCCGIFRARSWRTTGWRSSSITSCRGGFSRRNRTRVRFAAGGAGGNGRGGKVQGVFLTTESNKVPIRGGEIVENAAVEKPAARAGNYLDNGDFEVGLFPWGKPFGVSAVYGAENLDGGTAAHGRVSFKREFREA